MKSLSERESASVENGCALGRGDWNFTLKVRQASLAVLGSSHNIDGRKVRLHARLSYGHEDIGVGHFVYRSREAVDIGIQSDVGISSRKLGKEGM